MTLAQRLALQFRWAVSGSGLRPGFGGGRRLGSAGEFEGYRHYEPGDDLHSLDLRVYARLRRRVVRVLREDTAVPITLLVDRSASMLGIARENTTQALAEFFCAVAKHRGDPVRTFTFTDTLERLESGIPVRKALEERPVAGNSDYRSAFRALSADPAGRGVVLVISDGFGLADPDRDLAPLRAVGLPFWFAPLEPAERHPDYAGAIELVPRELEPQWRGTITEETRREYEAQLDRYHTALRRRLRSWGGDFFLLRTEGTLLDHTREILHTGTLLKC